MEKYKLTEQVKNEQRADNNIIAKDKKLFFLYDIISRLGGNSYNRGLLKIHTFESLHKWTEKLKTYFKEEIADFDLYCFASNWQGNMYCINYANTKIVYFDPATVEFFEADFSIQEFFDEVLPGDEYDILFEDYFEEAKKYLKIKSVPFAKSIGHKVFLHLGGEDDVRNLEIIDTEVLWELQIQTSNRINGV